MIRHVNERICGNRSVDFGTFEESPLRALRSLLVWEFGYGGHVAKLTDTMVCVHTPLGSKLDITTFSGDACEMELLVKAARLHQAVLSSVSAEDLAKAVHLVSDGIPLLVVHMTPLVLGRTAHATFCLLFNIEPTELMMRSRLEDLFSVYELAQEVQEPFEEVFSTLVAA